MRRFVWLDFISAGRPAGELRRKPASGSKSSALGIDTARDRALHGEPRNTLHRTMHKLTFLIAASAAAFAPTPNQRIDTRLHFNFGNFGGGKKVDEEEAVKLAETVDVVDRLRELHSRLLVDLLASEVAEIEV